MWHTGDEGAVDLMTSDVGIVFCSHIDWNAPWERYHQLASMFAGERPVIFAENPGMRVFDLEQAMKAGERFFANLRKSAGDNLLHPTLSQQQRNNLTAVSPWTLPSSGDKQSVKVNSGMFAKQVNKAMDKAGFKRAVLWTSCPTEYVMALINSRPWEAVIYDCNEDLPEAYPMLSRQLQAAETLLMKRADAALASSHLVERKLLRYNRQIVYYMPNGLDIDRFSRPTQIPEELSQLPRPIVGYLGTMKEKIFDMTLVANLTKSHPEWSTVLVGPVDRALIGKIDDAPLHLTGPVSYEDAPAYLRAFDIALIPFIESAATRAMNPLKVYEYLACGLPVISSPMPDLDVFGELVTQVTGQDKFSFAAHAAISEGRSRAAQRQQAAAQFNWDRHFTQLNKLLDHLTAQRTPV